MALYSSHAIWGTLIAAHRGGRHLIWPWNMQTVLLHFIRMWFKHRILWINVIHILLFSYLVWAKLIHDNTHPTTTQHEPHVTCDVMYLPAVATHLRGTPVTNYRQLTSNISLIISQNWNISCLVLQLPLPNPVVVRAAPTADAPTTSVWSTISLSTKCGLY